MSKKKSFSGSTMTLKDFHGGSIPSDLPLPSAPGVSVRPPDRWGPSSAIGIRSDTHHRQRPGSAGGGSGARLGLGFGGGGDERSPPFLSTPANIGRHFDEDERKPFEASAAAFPHRHQAPHPPLSDPVARPTPLTAPARSDLRPHARLAAGPMPNAWGLRREEVKPALDQVAPVQANPVVSLSSRFAQASAIEKVSSGRWQTKPVMPLPVAEFDVVRLQETVRVVDEARMSMPLQQEVKERGFYHNEGTRPTEGRLGGGPKQQQQQQQQGTSLTEGRLGGGPQQQQQGVVLDVGERPKLKLLPRTKLMDANEIGALEENQGHQPTVDHVHMENLREVQGSMNMPRPTSVGADGGSQVSERPRLNLKPRSLPVEQLDENTERERKSVFGGARPRELVLKERGIDDVIATNLEVTSPANRVKSDTPKIDMNSKLESPAQATRRSERSEGFPVEQRSVRDFEKKDFRTDNDKVDAQRASWRNDNRKNTREIEKPTERRSEPETWRKPVEQPKPEVPGTVLRVGKAASALELAQAFSRSVSDARSDNSFTNQRSLPGRVQAPFSRLTHTRDLYSGSNPRQINGY